jgi:hypothetical protein
MRVLVLAFVSLAGCGQVYRYTVTSTAPVQARAADCDFVVSGTLPEDKSLVELGVLEYERTPPHQIAKLKEMIHDQVCQAGGELVVGQINGFGYYVRAIVFRHVAPPMTADGAERHTTW